MKNWKTLKKELLENKEVAKEYSRLKPRYELISAIIDARIKGGLTQEELAKRIGTKQSAIARLESGKANPSVSFLEKLAAALGTKLQIQFN
ncbi:MAG: Transcriptional regulator, XRE family [Candidatus Gottesmanbacteria bacterium GW2011_GWA1_43_11]|uniref:Transcriptional regulator, XRE family n=1 Tax=Candidatus Gottesmanbacteria bacterium GW2011_GWA1_43_11 TaxID=1618436 RepID=A0A0G1F971_9BACT|nr:MAG: Transcriptional regulator, XRE family [Candidatus Gottesmanbacteria bacterium GW2011_GWA1_43_11]